MAEFLELPLQLTKVWSDFVVKNEDDYQKRLDINTITSSENARLVALNFFSDYSGLDGTAYGEGLFNFGMTEQEAYDIWEENYNNQEQLAKKQLIANGVTSISRSAYDGMILHHWATGKLLTSKIGDTEYKLLPSILNGDYERIANILINSSTNKQQCQKIATIIRLADYGKPKTRTWQREQGVFTMRDLNEKGTLSTDQLRRARFSYYAETGNFLPRTPESLQRQIAKMYNDTLITQTFTFSGNSTFSLERAVSMDPIEKLKVTINDAIQQHFYDFTLDGNSLTISKSMNTGDIVKTVIKI
jgi:hypothetical protein